jgi:hypothetical protein
MHDEKYALVIDIVIIILALIAVSGPVSCLIIYANNIDKHPSWSANMSKMPLQTVLPHELRVWPENRPDRYTLDDTQEPCANAIDTTITYQPDMLGRRGGVQR